MSDPLAASSGGFAEKLRMIFCTSRACLRPSTRAVFNAALSLALLAGAASCDTNPTAPEGGGSAGRAGSQAGSGGSAAAGASGASGGSGVGGSIAGGAGQGAGGGAGQAAGGGAGMANAGTSGMANGGSSGTPHQGPWKVMMLGDSVTGNFCYPQFLARDLIAGGHTNFTFVGTVTNNNGCGNGVPSVKSEGHGGYGVTYLPMTSTRGTCTKQPQGCGSYPELQQWAAEKPDIVLMHFATNDCWDHMGADKILAAWQAVIAEFRKNNPNVIFFVSKIIPLGPAPMEVVNLDAAVTPAWATANSTSSSPIRIIDHFTGFSTATDAQSDGVHPNASGAQKMSKASYDALVAAGYF